jgi:hypothetical protein
MAYTQFSASAPDGSTGNGASFSTAANANDKALRDGILSGRVQGFTLTVVNGTGTAEEPQYRKWTNGSTVLRATYTYGSGYVTQIVWELSINAEGAWDTICTETASYDGSKNQTGGANSSVLSWLWEWIGKFKDLRTSYNAHAAAAGASVHGLGNMSIQAKTAVDIDGGAIDGTPIGASAQAVGQFIQAREKHVAAGAGASLSVDCAACGSFDVGAGTGATTLSFTNPPPSGMAATMIGRIVNGGARTWTWPTGTKWPSGTAPTLTSSGTDLLSWITTDSGTTWHATLWSKDSR